jgi:hypothetical protein
MCPVCITAVALVAAGASSTGGLAAVIVRTLRRKRAARPVATDTSPKLRDAPIVARQPHHTERANEHGWHCGR